MAGAGLTSRVCAGLVVLVHLCDPRQLENSWILPAMHPKELLFMQKVVRLLKKRHTYVSAPYWITK